MKTVRIILKTYLFISCLAIILVGCGEGFSPEAFNPNFPSLGDTGIQPSASIDPSSEGQVIDVAPSIPSDDTPPVVEYSGAIGTISDQDPENVLCVLIDGEGGNADLAVCEANSANRETTTADHVCPDEIGADHCSSVNEGNEPDYCSVTGARDYVFSIINRGDEEAQVAYQVINVTLLPDQSCEDLNITEDSITADGE